jgi:hypothetical protein
VQTVKKLIMLVGALALASSLAFAADLVALKASTPAMEGAITGVFGGGITVTTLAHHLPGYGLQISVNTYADKKSSELLEPLKAILFGLAVTVKGLDANDWISVSYQSRTELLVMRFKPGNTASLETYLNGKKL